MTCLLNTYGKLSNLENIIKYLSNTENSPLDADELFKKKNEEAEASNMSWSNNWGNNWENEGTDLDNDEISKKNEEVKPSKITEKSENWFEKFILSISPIGNLAAIASKKNIVVCKGKVDSFNQTRFEISSRIDLNEIDKEFITSVICIPFASQRVSGEGLLEWTCIMVGFSSGNIRIYTENGTLLFTTQFHDTSVLAIKCRTYEVPKYIGWISQPEEVEILYSNNVLICIDGSNLFNFLKVTRKYAANAASDQNEMREALSSLNLDCKIWKFDSQELLTDFVCAGFTSENRFDQLFSASLIGGPNERFESIPPMANKYIAIGSNPFLNFYWAFENMPKPVLTEVKAVAGKVTSALMNVAKGWMGFSKSAPAAKPAPKIEPPTPLSSRCHIRDLRRKGESIIISPGNNLAATTDSFARVILIDVLKGIAIRIFKGYRDAQIGWICVDDESDEKTNKRYALYLIIYAPRRGLLEVWGCQQGTRVAAFNVGKNSKLIYPGYFMLTLNGSLCNQSLKSSQVQCFLIDELGTLKTLQIPFHLILSDKSNQRVRDTILLKKLKSLLREQKEETDSLWNNLNILLRDFKTDSIKHQALERILITSYLSAKKIYEVICQQLEIIEKQGDNLNTDSNKLGQFCRFNKKLINSYIFIMDLQDLNEVKIETEDAKTLTNDVLIKELSDLLQIEEDDIRNYFDLKNSLNRKNIKKVQFNEKDLKPDFELSKYIACFEFTTFSQFIKTNSFPNSGDEYSKSEYLELNKNLSFQEKKMLAIFLFSELLNKEKKFDEEFFNIFMQTLPLKKIQLLDLLVCAWLNKPFENIINLCKYIYILNGFPCNNTLKSDKESSSSENLNVQSNVDVYDDFENVFINDYFKKFKNTCENSNSIVESLFLCWVVRSIIIKSQIETSVLESLFILIDRLFCLTKFKILIISLDKPVLEIPEMDSFNLKSIITRGKGVFSELLAHNVIQNDIPPKLLNILDDDDEEEIDVRTEEKVGEDLKILLKDKKSKEFYDLLQETRTFLPKSLESDILLANCAWEAILIYNKNTEGDLKYLEVTLRHCSEIGNAILKQGLLSLIWHNCLIKKVSSLTNIIDKIGKMPKDKQLRQEAGINEVGVIKFLECVMTCLDLIMDANCSINEVPIFNYDQFWKDLNVNNSDLIPTNMIINVSSVNTSSSLTDPLINKTFSSSPSSKLLVELASEQKHINYHLCLFHYQLIRILYLISKYNIKSVRPLSFFDTKGKHTLFSELHTHPLISNDVDIKILNARKLFFTRAMNNIMENVEAPTNIKAKLGKEVTDNLNIVFNLSKDMGVDVEYIKRYYCCMLYALDYHSEAEKVLHTIKERELMASQLLVVVGNKINKILEANFDANLVAILSTNLSSWLKSLGPSEYRIHTIASKQAILELMGSLQTQLPDTFSDYKLCVELFDFIENSQFQIK